MKTNERQEPNGARKRVPPVLYLALAVFAGMFALTLLTPMIADDYNYAFIWATDIRIGNLGDIWNSMRAHRIFTNGRVFAHGFVQLFSLTPRWIFALCNAAVASCGALLLHRFLRQSGRPLRLTAVTLLLLWLCMPVFGQIFLWQDGACNYAWGLVLTLTILYPFYETCETGEAKLPLPGKLLALPMAFVAGAWSEHISFSLLAACFLALLLAWRRRKRFPLWLFALLVCGGCGYLYLMFAPSMLGGEKNERGALTPEAIEKLFARLDPLFSRVPGGRWTVLALLALLVGVLILCLRRNGRKTLAVLFAAVSAVLVLGAAALSVRILGTGGGLYGVISSSEVSLLAAFACFSIPFAAALFGKTEGKRLLFPALLFIGGISSLPLFLFASYFPARGCAVAVLFAVLSGVMTAGLTPQRRSGRAAAAVIAALFAVSLAFGTADILALHRNELLRQRLIREAQAGDGILAAPPHPVGGKYNAQYGLDDLNAQGEWPNMVIKDYYGLRQAYATEEEADLAGD